MKKRLTISIADSMLHLAVRNDGMIACGKQNLGMLLDTQNDTRWQIAPSSVSGMEMSPCGKWLGIGSEAGVLLCSLQQHGQGMRVVACDRNVNALRFLRDRAFLCTGSERICWHDLERGQMVRSRDYHRSVVTMDVEDDLQLLAAGVHKSVHVLDARHGRSVIELAVHQSAVRSVFFSHADRLLFTLSRDTALRVFDARQWDRELRPIYGGIGGFRMPHACEDLLATVAWYPKCLCLWNVAAARCVGSVDCGGPVNNLRFSKDGGTLAVLQSGVVNLYDVCQASGSSCGWNDASTPSFGSDYL